MNSTHIDVKYIFPRLRLLGIKSTLTLQQSVISEKSSNSIPPLGECPDANCKKCYKIKSQNEINFIFSLILSIFPNSHLIFFFWQIIISNHKNIPWFLIIFKIGIFGFYYTPYRYRREHVHLLSTLHVHKYEPNIYLNNILRNTLFPSMEKIIIMKHCKKLFR